ncbi:hypothetical protein GCM10023163_19300 [Aestuariibaculum suncheonense]
MALWGTVIGALLGSFPTNKLGRKKTLIWIGVFYTVSAIGSGLANDPYTFALFRFLGGLGVGASTIAAPAYISEIAPAKDRGKLVGLYQFNIVFGILIAFLSNYLLNDIGENAWRWMVGIEAIPAALYTIITLSIPKSPRWLLTKLRNSEAKNVLRVINPGVDPEQLMMEIKDEMNNTIPNENIFMKKYRLPLILAFLIAFFNQLSGINALLYYAPRILTEAGLEESSALLSSIGVGITNLLFTLLGITLIDKLGRKQLMYIGSFGYIISLSLVSAAFFFNWEGGAVPIFLFLFIAAHAIGQGTVIWVFISEIFPNHLRGYGQSFGSSVHWVLAAVVPSLVPVLFSTIGAGMVFLIFAIMMVFQLLFVIFMMPETKGISLEQLGKTLIKTDNSKTLKKVASVAVIMFFTFSCKETTKSSLDSETTSENIVYTEETLYRPNFHFTPKENWMNDPNGMFFLNDTYHLFFQYYPEGNKWGPMHWGHATSKDLITWTENPIALYPDELGYIFSGSAVVDLKNTSGFGDGTTPPIVAIFTHHDPIKERKGLIDFENQSIAYSIDEGKTWIKYANNPVLKNPGIKNFRDPKVVWDEDHQQWVMALAADDRTKFYSSKNLKEWAFISDFGNDIGAHGGVWECPDFFPMQSENSNETKWILLQSLNPGGPNGGSATQYFIGDFDGKTFKLDEDFKKQLDLKKAIWLDHGMDNYASVTWNNANGKNPISIGWMSNWLYAQDVPTETWRSSMTLPRELKLNKTENGFLICSEPVDQLENYYSDKITKEDIEFKEKTVLIDGKTIDLTKSVIDIKLTNLTADAYTFTLSNTIGNNLKFGLDNIEKYLFIDRQSSGLTNFSEAFGKHVTKAPLTKEYQEARIKIILDKTSIELFFNNGQEVLTEIFFPNEPFDKLTIESSRKEAKISTLNANKLNINNN